MIFSVYNPSTRAYDYYQTTTGSGATHAGAPAKSMFASALGAAPEQAAWSLPTSAQKIGSGQIARGRIATKGSLVPFAGELWQDAGAIELAALAAVAAYFLWRARR